AIRSAPLAALALALSIALAAELVRPSGARAGYDAWTAEGGPYGGRIHALVCPSDEPRRIYAGTERGGVFVSLGDGAGWEPRSEGLELTDVVCLAVDPLRGDTLFAGTGGGGVYRSTSAGAYWVEVGAGLTSPFINDLVFAPDASRLWAATSSGGVFVSLNGGLSWTPSNAGLTALSVRAIAFAPSDPEILFVGTSSGVFRSADAGATWAPRSSGLAHGSVGAVAVDPLDTNVVYAGTLGGGVYKSTDGGGSWAQAASGMGNLYVRELRIREDRPDTIWAATNRGLFETFDGAATWTARIAGMADTTAQALLRTDDTLYVGSYWGGVYAAAFPESGWAPRNERLSNRFVWELARSPHDPDEMWAASFGGLSRSDDRGETWVDVPFAPDTFDLRTVAPSPDDPIDLLAGAFYGGVFRSSDGGASWTKSSSGLGASGTVTAVRYKPDDAAIVLAATYGGTYKSVNGGANWSASHSGMGSKKVWGMDGSGVAPGLVYAGTYGSGLYRSRDFGGTWQSVPIGESYIRAVAIDPSDTSVFYAGGYYLQSGLGGVYKSTDGGATWVSKNAGLGNESIWSIAVDPLDTQHLLVATVDGAYESSNGGDLWQEPADGLLPRDIRWVSFAGERMLAGSYGGSVPWYEEISTGVELAGIPAPGPLSLLVYPNPFNATTTVRVDFEGGPVRAAVYDVAGRLVRELDGGDSPEGGRLAISWNGTDERGREVASGVYLVRAEGARGWAAQRIVLVR
ncbi:MAG: T9SS C-terminal target domain-containing protein, partial [Candidatus Latescibacterota bacterium]